MAICEYLNLIAVYGGLGLIFYGIRVMAKGAEMRSADSERKHTETMAESERKHTERRWPCANSSSEPDSQFLARKNSSFICRK